MGVGSLLPRAAWERKPATLTSSFAHVRTSTFRLPTCGPWLLFDVVQGGPTLRYPSVELHDLTADERIVFVAGADVESWSAVEELTDLAAVRVVESVVAGTAVRLVGDAAQPGPEPVVARSAPEDVRTLATGKQVVASIAVSLLGLWSSHDPIVSGGSVDHGVVRRERGSGGHHHDRAGGNEQRQAPSLHRGPPRRGLGANQPSLSVRLPP